MNEEIQVITLTESEAKDRVLKHLLEQWEKDGQQSKRYFSSTYLNHNVFGGTHIEKVEHLIEKIIDFDEKLLRTITPTGDSKYKVCATSFTNDFIKKHGGFEKIFKDNEQQTREAIRDKKWDRFAKPFDAISKPILIISLIVLITWNLVQLYNSRKHIKEQRQYFQTIDSLKQATQYLNQKNTILTEQQTEQQKLINELTISVDSLKTKK